jgi:5-methylcytosine-specific restriction endonuclease McrA
MIEQNDDKELDNMVAAIKDGVYAFDLKMLCGGYAYFSTFTVCVGLGESHRDIRKPDLLIIGGIYNSLRDLGHFKGRSFLRRDLIIGEQEQYEKWLYRKGWGFVTKEYVQNHMSQWLRQRECLRSPVGTFTDIELVPPSTLAHYHSRIRDKVLERDGKQCLLCETKTQLTMQHVIPHSYGGETTLRNLVTLCKECNQKCGVEFLMELYDFAGLHSGFDPSLVKKIPTKDSIRQAMYLSGNLMQTRCEVW